MRNVEPSEAYQAADWVCHHVLPGLTRLVTGLPWPAFEGMPHVAMGGRIGVKAATDLHPTTQRVAVAASTALGDDHALTTIAKYAATMINECKFQRLSANICETAVTRTAEIARLALPLGLADEDVKRVAAWEALADDAPTFSDLVASPLV